MSAREKSKRTKPTTRRHAPLNVLRFENGPDGSEITTVPNTSDGYVEMLKSCSGGWMGFMFCWLQRPR